MAAQPDISSILAALAAQRPGGTPNQAPPQPPPGMSQPPPGYPPHFPGSMSQSATPLNMPGFAPPYANPGNVDLSSIRPVNSGSVSFQDALARAQGLVADRGQGRSSAAPPYEDPRLAGRSNQRQRSRSPPRRDNYNPYRDERRDDPRRAGMGYGRERTRSPPETRGRDQFSPQRGGGGRDRPDDNSEVITIDSALVGLVIGRQGENLRRVEQETGARVQFLTGPEEKGPQRQCRLSGPVRARMEAKREINRIIEENGGNPARNIDPRGAGGDRGGRGGRQQKQQPPPQQQQRQQMQNDEQPPLREGEDSIQIMVPDRTVGLIIGRGGETIRDLQERSGCHVNIVGENKSINGLRPVNLIGSVQAAQRAKELILEIVDSDTRTQGPERNAARQSAGMADPSMPPYGAQDNKINESIQVPSEAVGMIIGKGGETIKEMQNQSSCKINVSPPSGADIEREIGLIGSRQAIEHAKNLIWEKVDTVREKNGAKRGGRDNDDSRDRYQQPQAYGQQDQQAAGGYAGQQMQQPGAPAQAADPAADPYAPYGGYQAYVAMWYSAMAAQQAGQGGAPPQGPPGQQ